MKPILDAEVLIGAVFSVEEAPRACGVDVLWLEKRVDAGVLHVHVGSEGWRFDCFTLVRARRVAHLETCFDADPQLAALTADLIEEVARLRRQLELR